MVMKAPVWGEALDEICTDETLLVVPTPAGRLFTQAVAERWSAERHLVFACGRYEGIDQRVADDAARRMRVEEVSIGDYVLTGGESAALVMIEAVVRLLPEVLAARRGGEFPVGEIGRFIDGRFAPAAHGTLEMPVWGERFGERVPDAGISEEVTRGNIAVLIEYLKSIQEPARNE